MEELISKIPIYLEDLLVHLANPEMISADFYIIWQGLRIIFIIIALLFLGLLVFLFSVNGYLKYRYKEDAFERLKGKPFFNIKLKSNWDEIMEHAKDENESERKLAVIEADDTLNDALSKLGYEGDTLLEKLEGLTPEVVPNLEDLEDAHRERRDISYDPSKGLSKEEAKRLISIYEETFKYFQIF